LGKIERNLTEGSVVRGLVLFALPFMLSNLIQTLYNIVDMFIVGRYCGPIGIAGVNVGGQVTLLITNVVVGLSVGATVIIAQYLGSRNRQAIKKTISTFLIFLFIAAVIVTFLMLISANLILHLIKTPVEAYSESYNYLNVTVIGTIFIFGYNALSAIMRGLGDSKTPLYFVGISCVINIILDLILVGILKMQAMGAGIATVISQGISMFLCIFYLKKRDFIFDFKLSSMKFYKEYFIKLMKVGIPTAIQNVATNISFLVITALVNILGVTASAAVGVVSKINGFAILPMIAIGSSISAMVAQNMGAGEIKRAKKTLYTGIGLGLIFALPIFIFVQVFPNEIIKIFSDDAEMIKDGIVYLTTFSIDYFFAAFTFSLAGFITGCGHTTFASLNGILSTLGFRVPMSTFFGISMGLGLFGIAIGGPLSSICAIIMSVCFILSGKWKNNNVIKKQVK